MDASRLKDVPLFASLNGRQRKTVAQFAEEIDVPTGQPLVREGDWAYEFFVIEKGTCEVRHGEERIAELGPGDFLGEVGVMGSRQRIASVVATSPMTLIALTAQQLKTIAVQMPDVELKLRAAIEERTRALAEA